MKYMGWDQEQLEKADYDLYQEIIRVINEEQEHLKKLSDNASI